MTTPAELVLRLRGWCTDWNGAQMVRGEPPRDGLHCDILLDSATTIERLSKELEEAREQYDNILSTWAESRKLHLAAEALISSARSDALEEAARVAGRDHCTAKCRNSSCIIARGIAAAIRSLKTEDGSAHLRRE